MGGEVERVQRNLETFVEVRGLVFGDAFEGEHELVQMALRAVGLQRGRVYDEVELGVLVERIRKQLVWQQSEHCLMTCHWEKGGKGH